MNDDGRAVEPGVETPDIDALTERLSSRARSIVGDPRVSVAGEVAKLRKHAKGLFVTLLSDSGRSSLNVRFRRAPHRRMSLGDWIHVEGRVASSVWDSGVHWALTEPRILACCGKSRRWSAQEEALAPLRARGLHPPELPDREVRTVALVTAEGIDGDVDFRDAVRRARVEILRFNVARLGADAICGALESAQQSDADVVVITRGGGSPLDMQEFDHPALAKAVQECRKPILVGAGHKANAVRAAEFASDPWNYTPTGLGGRIATHNDRVRARRARETRERQRAAELDRIRLEHDRACAGYEVRLRDEETQRRSLESDRDAERAEHWRTRSLAKVEGALLLSFAVLLAISLHLITASAPRAGDPVGEGDPPSSVGAPRAVFRSTKGKSSKHGAAASLPSPRTSGNAAP